MNANQTARQDMFNTVITEANNKPEALEMIPEFRKGIDRLKVITSEIQRLRIEQEKDTTGVSTKKGDTMEDLSDLNLEVSGGVYSYANSINDVELMGRVNYTSGVIGEMNHSQILAAAEIVLAEAKKIPIAVLAEFGISAADLTELERLIILFKDVKPAPRTAQVDRTSHTEAIRLLFMEATALFKNTLDRLAIQFRRKDPDFYLKYRGARNVVYRSASSPTTPPAV